MKFMLMSCVEREIDVPRVFDTLKDAQEVMNNELIRVLGSPDDYDKDDDYGIGEYTAWANVRDNCDWKILCISVDNNGETVISEPVPSLKTARQISIIWSVEDVLEVCPGLSDEQAMDVLDRVKRYHNATIGVTWETLKFWADELFPTDTDS